VEWDYLPAVLPCVTIGGIGTVTNTTLIYD
jgi:hypothetical protein